MEQEIMFLNTETIYSRKKDQYFHIVRYCIGDQVHEDFVDEDTINKIRKHNLVFKTMYKGILTFIKNKVQIQDILPLKG